MLAGGRERGRGGGVLGGGGVGGGSRVVGVAEFRGRGRAGSTSTRNTRAPPHRNCGAGGGPAQQRFSSTFRRQRADKVAICSFVRALSGDKVAPCNVVHPLPSDKVALCKFVRR